MMIRTVHVVMGMLLFLLVGGVALGEETPLSVQLNARVNETIHKIIDTQRDAEKQSQQIEEGIKTVVNRIRMSNDDSEIYRLQKEYIALRAEALQVVAAKVVTIEEHFSSIASDLSQLDALKKDSSRSGIGQGIRRDDPVAMKAITETFKGFGNLIDMVETLDPNANLENTRSSVVTLDEVARQFFRSEGDSSLRDQAAFIKEAMVTARSVQRLIGVERDMLLKKLYLVDSKNMIRQFGQLKQVIFNDLDVAGLFNGLHRQDDDVLNAGSDTASFPTSGRRTDISQLGQNYN